MFFEKSDKWYLDFYLVKKFILTSLVSYSLLVLFVKKLRKEIEFCINYQKLNTITKKDCYLIFFIKEILAQFENIKYFVSIIDPFPSNTYSIIRYLTFYIILYKYTLTKFLSIVKYYKIIIFMFAKFYNTYKRLDYKSILINVSFIFQNKISQSDSLY